MATASTNRNLAVIPGGSPEGTSDDLVGSIKRYIDGVVAPLREKILVQEAEIAALKAKDPQPGRDGLPGVPGPAGRDGRDGERGADGLGFDDLEVAHDGERALTFRFAKGERVKAFPVTIPAEIYRGVWREGSVYTRGDTVTFGGASWHCNAASTLIKPGEGAKDWTLAVKAGRPGKNGKSAYEIAVDHGFKGGEAEWLKSLRGPPGKDLTPRGSYA